MSFESFAEAPQWVRRAFAILATVLVFMLLWFLSQRWLVPGVVWLATLPWADSWAYRDIMPAGLKVSCGLVLAWVMTSHLASDKYQGWQGRVYIIAGVAAHLICYVLIIGGGAWLLYWMSQFFEILLPWSSPFQERLFVWLFSFG